MLHALLTLHADAADLAPATQRLRELRRPVPEAEADALAASDGAFQILFSALKGVVASVTIFKGVIASVTLFKGALVFCSVFKGVIASVTVFKAYAADPSWVDCLQHPRPSTSTTPVGVACRGHPCPMGYWEALVEMQDGLTLAP